MKFTNSIALLINMMLLYSVVNGAALAKRCDVDSQECSGCGGPDRFGITCYMSTIACNGVSQYENGPLLGSC
jgi:hypothetical protein